MLAVRVTEFGGPEVLVAHQVPDPVPGPGEVVVAVSAVDVLYVDTQVRSGWGQEFFPMRPPYVPGDGVAGEVVAVGDGVDAGWVGRRVVGWTDNTGGYSERATVAADKLVELPDDRSFAEAAALSHDGPMALTVLETAAVKPGERVLVLGANGGAGLLVTGLAARTGAQVTGAARGDAKQRLVLDAGAHTVVDPGNLAELGRYADAVFDGVGGALGTAAFGTVRDGGRIFSYGAATGTFADIDEADAARRGITVYPLSTFAKARDEMATLMTQVLQDTTLRPVIGATYPIAEAAGAHAAMESRTVLGKILLVV
jgi:NADPH:quinone reductase